MMAVAPRAVGAGGGGIVPRQDIAAPAPKAVALRLAPGDLAAEGADPGDKFHGAALSPAAPPDDGGKVVKQTGMPSVRLVGIVAVIYIVGFHIQPLGLRPLPVAAQEGHHIAQGQPFSSKTAFCSAYRELATSGAPPMWGERTV